MDPTTKTEKYFITFSKVTKMAIKASFENCRIVETDDMIVLETTDKKKLVITATIT